METRSAKTLPLLVSTFRLFALDFPDFIALTFAFIREVILRDPLCYPLAAIKNTGQRLGHLGVALLERDLILLRILCADAIGREKCKVPFLCGRFVSGMSSTQRMLDRSGWDGM